MAEFTTATDDLLRSEIVSPNGRAMSDELYRAFTRDFKDLLHHALDPSTGRSGHVIKYNYLDVLCPTPFGPISGAELWNDLVMLGSNSRYYIPASETRFIHEKSNIEYFSKLFPESGTIIELGPGSDYAVVTKTLPSVRTLTGRPLNTKPYSYVAIDQISSYASHAAQMVESRNPGIKTTSIHGDFTEPHKLNISGDSDSIYLMWGLTASQFPLQKTEKNEKSFGDLLKNLGQMIDYNGLLIATVDTTVSKDHAIDTYTGKHSRALQEQFWRTAKHIITSRPGNLFMVDGKDVDPIESRAIFYNPRFEEGKGLIHSSSIMKHITLRIDGEPFRILPGTEIDTGCSEKRSVPNYGEATTGTGWEICNAIPLWRSPLYAVTFVARNTSEALRSRASNPENLRRVDLLTP